MKWIKVADKLPIPCKDILFTDGEQVYAGWLESYEEVEDPCFWDALDKSWYGDITHWMKLPKIPGRDG